MKHGRVTALAAALVALAAWVAYDMQHGAPQVEADAAEVRDMAVALPRRSAPPPATEPAASPSLAADSTAEAPRDLFAPLAPSTPVDEQAGEDAPPDPQVIGQGRWQGLSVPILETEGLAGFALPGARLGAWRVSRVRPHAVTLTHGPSGRTLQLELPRQTIDGVAGLHPKEE